MRFFVQAAKWSPSVAFSYSGFRSRAGAEVPDSGPFRIFCWCREPQVVPPIFKHGARACVLATACLGEFLMTPMPDAGSRLSTSTVCGVVMALHQMPSHTDRVSIHLSERLILMPAPFFFGTHLVLCFQKFTTPVTHFLTAAYLPWSGLGWASVTHGLICIQFLHHATSSVNVADAVLQKVSITLFSSWAWAGDEFSHGHVRNVHIPLARAAMVFCIWATRGAHVRYESL